MKNLARAGRSALAFLFHAVRAGGAAPALSLSTQFIIVFMCFGTATAVRALIGIWAPDVVPFATYFPAIAVAALIGGFVPGLWTWLLSMLAGLLLFMQPAELTALTPSQAASAVLFAASAALELLIASWVRDLFWESRKSEARYRALVDAASLVNVFDAAGACREPQKGWEALTGMAWPLYGKMGWLDAVHQEDRAKVVLTPDKTAVSEMEVRIWDAAGRNWRWFSVRAVPVLNFDGDIEERVAALTDITERKATEERAELLLEDMRHRFKNFIAVIQALVTAAMPKGNADVAAFADTFLRRVHALQSAGDLVMKENAQDVDLAEVIPAALAPFGSDFQSRFLIDGPSLLLREQTVGGIALACHELATNAAKYGALASEHGKVAIGWRSVPEGDGERVTLEWIERGGSPVAKPTRQGFGTRIIKSAVSRETGGSVTLDYLPKGLECRMTFTLTRAHGTA